jgi:hypothetical protein
MDQLDPPDEALLELGRLTWAAILLEDVVYEVCRAIKPRHGPSDDVPIGTQINEALTDLGECPPDQMRSTATAWLREAKDALDLRNATLHAVPVTFIPMSGTTPLFEDGTDWLTHFPRDKNRPAIHTATTVAGFTPVRERLQRARKGWIDVAVHPWATYPRNT